MSTPQPIPEWWCNAVVDALESYDPHRIDWTSRAFQLWNKDSCGKMWPEAYPWLIDALSTPGITGYETTSYEGQKATYEFFFRYRPDNGGAARNMYGKIALMDDCVRILILSAHNPKRSTL